jgi:hypothetical protein
MFAPKIKFNYTSAKETENIIKFLKSKNSNGYDEISVKILKISVPFISSPLTYICNRSLTIGVFPTWLKYSEIKPPLFKNGGKTNMSKYRPVSLLKSFSKVVENVIYARLHQHVISNNITANEQYGFRSNSSTETAPYKLTNEILYALNNRILVGGISCDLKKASDFVNYDIL